MFYFILHLLWFLTTTFTGVFIWNMADVFYRVMRDNPKESNTEEKIISNLISGSHAYFVVFLDSLKYLLGFNFNPIYFHIFFSTGYFAYDTIIQYKKYKTSGFNIEQLGYGVHHIFSIIFLWVTYYYYEVRHLEYIFGLIETSNLSSYVVYHCMKSGYSPKIVQRLKEIQVLNYVFFRIPVLGFVIYDIWDIMCKYNVALLFVVIYLMGLHWSWKLFSGIHQSENIKKKIEIEKAKKLK